jgi:hypothetical protein
MRIFSEIRKETDDWLFDYCADTDPSGELHSAGAILVECEIGDVRCGSGLQNARYWGKAYSASNTQAALRVVQERLGAMNWSQVSSI